MTRATTPTHVFLFEDDPSEYSRILITYAQDGKIVMEKGKDDLTIERIDDSNVLPCGGNQYRASFRLTQEETNKFKAGSGKTVQVQVRVLTTEGEAFASDKKSLSVYDVLNDEVLV